MVATLLDSIDDCVPGLRWHGAQAPMPRKSMRETHPMHEAASRGSIAAFRLLLCAGAEALLFETSSSGWLPLHQACQGDDSLADTVERRRELLPWLVREMRQRKPTFTLPEPPPKGFDRFAHAGLRELMQAQFAAGSS